MKPDPAFAAWRPMAGFTLIEVMIVIAVIAILASIALPSYNEHIVKTRRGDVQRQLVAHAQALERWFTANGTYRDAGGGACGIAAPADTRHYTFVTLCGTATTFALTATPVPASSQASDGTQTLDNTGSRGGSVKDGQWRS